MQIRKAKKSDIKDIITFIKLKYLKRNHILVRKKKIFYFFFTKGKKVNFILCKKKSKIIGILGYIKNSHWGVNSGKKDIWLGWWQVENRLNGLLLIKYLIKYFQPNILVAYGVQNKKLRDRLFQNFNLKQYIISNKLFKTNKFNTKVRLKCLISSKNLQLIISKKILNFSDIQNKHFPKKNYNYYKNKYENNKFYKYFFMHFKFKSKIKAIFTCKIISNIKHKIIFIKVLEIYGKLPSVNFKNLIIEYLKQENIQHVDLQCHGISTKEILRFGYKKNNKIIQNFFEPYNRKYSPHTVSLICNRYKKNLIFFSGDGDNERPRV
jgi:hypothetical protein